MFSSYLKGYVHAMLWKCARHKKNRIDMVSQKTEVTTHTITGKNWVVSLSWNAPKMQLKWERAVLRLIAQIDLTRNRSYLFTVCQKWNIGRRLVTYSRYLIQLIRCKLVLILIWVSYQSTSSMIPLNLKPTLCSPFLKTGSTIPDTSAEALSSNSMQC